MAGRLGLPADWGSLIDRDIIKAVIEQWRLQGCRSILLLHQYLRESRPAPLPVF